LASGVLLGLASATKVAVLINVPVYFLFLAWLLYEKRAAMPKRELLVSLLAWGLGVGILVASVGLFNYIRFGNPLQTGYGNGLALFDHPLLSGLYGLLLSPGKSLFLYSPIVLLAVPSFALMARQHFAETLASLGIIAVHLLTYASYSVWHGDGTWGPRFMVF